MAAELVGGAFLSAFLQVLFDRVASREVVDYIRGKKLNERLLKKLKITLLSVNAVINDAEEKQFRCPLVKEWLHELKDAVYDAEDIWDEIATDALQYNLQAKSSTTVNQMKLKIEEILDRLEFIAKQKDVLGLKHGVAEKQSWKIPTSSLVEESHVYGRDDDREAIIKLLLSDGDNDNNICVIPIVGMAGIGKTTLAQVVYNDNRVKENFEFAAWICVSEDFDVCRITKTVLEAVTSVCCDFKDLNLLQLKLKEELSGKKFLLVLDDVWNENCDNWEALRRPFNSGTGTQGSKIIVTTRNESVASIMRTVPVHYLNQLTDEDCWLLFAKCAFGNYGSSDAHPILEGIGREIVKKCKGLPLAVKTLGCLSRLKLDAEEWDKILKSDIWEFSNDQSNILPALRLSYDYLPSHLKRCFAYCSIFPKDYEFKKEQLIQLWMAEDLLQLPKRNKRIEEVGDEYFHELVSRSFFQRSASENSCFVMHDLINDLARFVSGELCFRLGDDNPKEISEKTRHLSYVMALEDLFKRFEIFYKAKCLRTFLPLYLPDEFYCLSNKVQHNLLIKLRCLRVLSLSNYHSISELPDSIGELIHLRYLDLSRTLIKRLPETVCIIYNLQTLKLAYCYRLRQLPTGIHNLVNLRNLDMNGTCVEEMPTQMSKLESLQMLSTFIVGKENGTKIGELGKLSNLRGTLSIKKLKNVANAKDAFEAKLKDKKHLEELVLDWGYGNTDDTNQVRYVLEKLVPHTTLKKLQVHNYGGTRFPHWLGDRVFCNIISVSLHDCEHCCILPPLGQLHSLKHLSIEGFDGVVTVGPEFYGNSSQPFPSLEILKFSGMSALEEWYSFGVEDECIRAFPHLKELRIESCPSLIGSLPINLPSLRKLVIEYCEQIVSPLPRAPAIRELELIKCDKVVLRELPHTLHSLKMKGCQFVVETLLGEISTQIQACPRRLDISDCSTLMSFPGSCLPTALSFLSIKNCEKLKFPLHQYHTSLEHLLIVDSCGSLGYFPIDLFPNLNSLTIGRCKSLKHLSVIAGPRQVLASVTCLKIQGCRNLVSFPEGGLSAPNLNDLWVDECENLKSLPERMHVLLPSLRELRVSGCPKLVSFPEGGLPSSLSSLYIGGCNELIACRMDWHLQDLPLLASFGIFGECEKVESFPEEELLPYTLTYLSIVGLSRLKTLDGRGLQHLISLRTLVISGCSELQSMPEEGLPMSLVELIIRRCPLLREACKREKGEDWPKIAHISCIEIEDDSNS
ncbi:putative disease resistance protein At3g14460 isoform X2 [Juglans regia]|uniref:Disease resistance protein At3g14460 isoform X2 n=2 Tax=Juglans regia TaxID=51240 RepID=A0A2I4ED99_JUGRE|nr:putative disease resistance protein At3g14460 isoform X2 [Juglans regia]